jgi:phage portal protein BeeE
MKYNGTNYLLNSMSRGTNSETIENSFVGYVNGAYKSNGVVFACMVARMLVFSEARFIFQELDEGKPDDLVYANELKLFEKPWPNGTTGELLSRAIQDVDLSGNHFVVRENSHRLRRLRPDWMEIVLTAPPDQAAKSDVAGYIYKPGGTTDPTLWEVFPIDGSRGRVAHWCPIPDPDALYRGMSWLTPVIREIQSDIAASRHKLKFFENAATPNLAVSFKETVTQEQFEAFMEAMNQSKHGVEHAYETLYLGGGADVSVIGADLKQMDFKVTQGHGETRIAAAARVHPTIVGLSEGMQGSSLNAGNFKVAQRGFADGTMRPLWRSIAAAYSNLIQVPEFARLWYDTRDVAFLREDVRDLSDIQASEAGTIAKLVKDGYTPESVIQAVVRQDWTLLEHTGLYSVQLWPPEPEGAVAAPDGGGSGKPQFGTPGKTPDTPQPKNSNPAKTKPNQKPSGQRKPAQNEEGTQ